MREKSGLKALLGCAILIASTAAPGTARAQQEPRPTPPQPSLPAVTAADCEAPATRDALLADPEAVIETASRHGMELNRHSERLMEWRGDQFVRAGRWTEADKRAFAARLLENEAFVTEAAAGINMAMEVLEPAMQAADESRPAAERCRSLIAMVGVFDRLTESVERQWRIVDEAYAAEARRLGVSLD